MSTPYEPYQPPKPEAPPVEAKPASANSPSPGDARIRYMYAYGYIFENPNWMTNVLYGFVCILSSAIIPIIGQLLFIGYQYEVCEHLHRYPGRTYPDFDFNKFSYYLQRSLWPFLVSLICMLPLFMIAAIPVVLEGIAMAAWMGSADKDIAPIIFLGGVFVMSMTFSLIIMVLAIPMQPIILRAGLAQDFGEAFKFSWAMDYLKRVWLEVVLFQMFMAVSSIPLAILGEMCCFVGLYASIAVLMLAQAGMMTQLYNLYLARGGEPIPLKEPPAPIAAAYGS